MVVGVDVGGVRKGFHAVALCDGRFLERKYAIAPEDIVAWCLKVGAKSVAVDAPCRWSANGRARHAERALAAEGIFTFATPGEQVARAKPFYRWMLNGAELYGLLERRYKLFDGRKITSRMCLETFPHAVACTLAGRILPAKEKRVNRRDTLRRAGLDTSMLPNIDYVDAALCAVAALSLRSGAFRAYGDAAEGIIVVPKKILSDFVAPA